MIDWKKERKEFPICEQGSYFLSAATGPLSKKVFEAFEGSFKLLRDQGCINEEAFFQNQEDARLLASACLQVPPESLAFLSNSSTGMNFLAEMIKKSNVKLNDTRNEVIFLADEFPSSTIPWIHHGFNPVILPTNKGVCLVEDILKRTGPKTRLVVHSMVQFLTGFKQDIKLLAFELKKKNIPLILNATQALGAIPVYPKNLGVAAMVSSLHKWVCAGLGLSLLYLDEEFKEELSPPWLSWASAKETWRLQIELGEMRSLPQSLEIGTTAMTNFNALKVAFSQIQRLRAECIHEKNWKLAKKLALGLHEKGVNLYSVMDWEKDYPKSMSTSIVSFMLSKTEENIQKLKREHIYLSFRKGIFRAAVHYFNDEYDIDQLISLVP